MNSIQFSEILALKREGATLSIEEMAARMNVSPAVVKDLERGIYNTSMELAMNYILSLGQKLVISTSANPLLAIISTYEEFVMWIAKRWPRIYSYKQGTIDAYGNRHFKAYEKEGNSKGIGRKRFLELAESKGLTINILTDTEIQKIREKQRAERAKQKEDFKKAKREANIAIALGAVMLVVSIYPSIKWVELMCSLADWMSTNSPSEYFASLIWSFLALCVYFIAIPFGILTIAVFLASLPSTKSLIQSAMLAFGILGYCAKLFVALSNKVKFRL